VLLVSLEVHEIQISLPSSSQVPQSLIYSLLETFSFVLAFLLLLVVPLDLEVSLLFVVWSQCSQSLLDFEDKKCFSARIASFLQIKVLLCSNHFIHSSNYNNPPILEPILVEVQAIGVLLLRLLAVLLVSFHSMVVIDLLLQIPAVLSWLLLCVAAVAVLFSGLLALDGLW